MDPQAKVDTLEWELIQNGGSAKKWIELAQAVEAIPREKKTDRLNAVRIIFERAVRAMPLSYKVWTTYIDYCISEITDQCSPSEKFQLIRRLYERALEHLPKMPMLWVFFIQFVMSSTTPRITMVRHLLQNALKALPATQHHHIWTLMKKWTRKPMVPSETVKALWRVYLVFDKSVKERRGYYFLLLDRGNMNDLVCEWMSFFYSMYSSRTLSVVADVKETSILLLERPDVWDCLQLAFETKGWSYTEDLEQLSTLVHYGATKATSATAFSTSFCMFLYGQGSFERGRALLRKLLLEAPDPSSFTSVFTLAVEMEDELLEAFAHHPKLLELSTAEQQKIIEHIFGAECQGNPLFQIRRLADDHDMLLNKAQLRNFPYSVPLWLKGVEIMREQFIQGSIPIDGLIGLWRQSIDKCVQGMTAIDTSVAQLYSSFAEFLLDSDRFSEAVNVLEEGAWDTNFTAVEANADLLGFLVEIRFLNANSSSSKVRIAEDIITRLSGSSQGRRKGARSALLGNQSSSQLGNSCLPWLLVIDLLWALGTQDSALNATKLFSNSKAYTPEASAHVAHQLYERGLTHMAIREFEHSLMRFKDNTVGVLFLLSQYISLLCFHYRNELPLDMFRELSQMALNEAPKCIIEAPRFTVDLLMSCAAVEGVHGLYGQAIGLAQATLNIALQYLEQSETHLPLLFGLTENLMEMSLQFKGINDLRSVCSGLMSAVTDSRLIQRIAVHWAAVEKRCGYTSNAHTVMCTYSTTQDPDDERGTLFWELWESICNTVEEFEVLVQRRQQFRVGNNKSS